MSFFKSIEQSKLEQKRLKYALFSQKFSNLHPSQLAVAKNAAISNFNMANNTFLDHKRKSL